MLHAAALDHDTTTGLGVLERIAREISQHPFEDRRAAVGLELRELAAIVAFSGDIIISASLDSTVTTWDSAAEAIFAYRSKEVIGQPNFV